MPAKIVATIEARMTSSRLPGKVLLPLGGKPALERMIERIRFARYIDEIVVATTVNDADDPIVELCERVGAGYFRGSEDDVLERVLGAAHEYDADYICELTGDCPLIDPVIIDSTITSHLRGTYDYTSSNLFHYTFPIGFDTQIFATPVLEKVAGLTDDPIDRVHVSCFIYHNPKIFKLNGHNANPEEFGPQIRLTLDTKEDYEVIKTVFEALHREGDFFSARGIMAWLKKNPEILEVNRKVRKKALEEG